MDTDIVSVKPLAAYRLEVTLASGQHGVFDLRPHLSAPGLARLADPAYFAQVGLLAGAATWPAGEDIAPATVAAHLKTLESA